MRTEILVVLDRSGSMSSIRSDMEGGFNSFIAEQRNVPGEAYVTLVQFDDQAIETVYQRKALADVPKLALAPRGCTPLLDAIGRTVVTQGERFAAAAPDQKPEKVILVIITDGHENASKDWTKPRVMELLKRQQDEWKWSVTYIGANQDAIAEAAKIGIAAHSALNYRANAGGTRGLFASLSNNVKSTRVTGESYAYTSDDRSKATGN